MKPIYKNAAFWIFVFFFAVGLICIVMGVYLIVNRLLGGDSDKEPDQAAEKVYLWQGGGMYVSGATRNKCGLRPRLIFRAMQQDSQRNPDPPILAASSCGFF